MLRKRTPVQNRTQEIYPWSDKKQLIPDVEGMKNGFLCPAKPSCLGP